ncbi:MAG: PEP/pyruvate-binding domain-containing protein, partial [Planctomycetota bacterium]
MPDRDQHLILWFSEVGKDDAELVGGKGASLGELYRELVPEGVRVPNGFTTTATAYRRFLEAPASRDAWLDVPEAEGLPRLKAEAIREETLAGALRRAFDGARPDDHLEMHARTKLARDLVVRAPVPIEVERAIRSGYDALCDEYGAQVDVAVRSSATVEDSEEASFAGQCESFLNVHGADDVVTQWKHCCASLFTERAVSYQVAKELDPLAAALAVVVMKMVRSDLATSGVMFTLDPDSGHRGVIHISSSYGLGELVVQGSVSPDHFTVWKEGLHRGFSAIVHRHLGAKDVHMVYASQGGTSTESVDTQGARRRQWSLTREEISELARMAMKIEAHYGQPMDIEWAKDGRSQDLFIVQARPETVHARAEASEIVRYQMPAGLAAQLAADGRVLAEGQAVGTRIGAGRVRLYKSY